MQALLANNLTSFTEFAFDVVRPRVIFKPNWHFEAVTHKLSQVASGEVRRLIITLPPRTLKSLCASVALPAWFLGRYPWERVLVVSYSEILARTHANDFRLVVNDPIYQATFPAMRLARDTDREIITTKRGKRIATSIDGTLTGLGGNLIIIDDPLKLGDAMSEAVRARVIEWYRSTLLSRADDKTEARIVLVMQRVHQDDLAGYLQEQGGFEVLNLPAIAQRDETYFLGDGRTYDRQKGELLHPEHEPAVNICRAVRVAIDKAVDGQMLFQRRNASSGRLGGDTSSFLPALQPLHPRTGTDLKAFGRFPPRCSRNHRLKQTHAQVQRTGFRHHRAP